jgi:hypothetical protein
VVLSEQINSGTKNVTLNVERMKLSGAHVFISFLIDRDHFEVLKEAYSQNLYGKDYVWFGTTGSAVVRSTLELNNTVNENAAAAMIGTIGVQVGGPIDNQDNYQGRVDNQGARRF